MFEKGVNDRLNKIHFHDMQMDIVNRELEREKAQRHSGSIAENILQDVGVVAAAKTI